MSLHSQSRETRTDGIFVTGSSGYVGQALSMSLAEQGSNIIAVYRKTLPEPHKNILPLCSDLRNPDLLVNSLHGTNTIIHLAWDREVECSKKLSRDSRNNIKTNLQNLDNLITAAERTGCKRFIFLSCSGADSSAPLAELSMKYEAERIILRSGIPERIIVRSPLIFGGEHYRDRSLRIILNLMRFPLIYPIPGRAEKIAYVHLSDLVSVLVELATRDLPVPVGIIQVGPQHPIEVAELFQRISRRFSEGRKFAVAGLMGRLISTTAQAGSRHSSPTAGLEELRSYGHLKIEAIEVNNPFQILLPKKWQLADEFFREPTPSGPDSSRKHVVGILS